MTIEPENPPACPQCSHGIGVPIAVRTTSKTDLMLLELRCEQCRHVWWAEWSSTPSLALKADRRGSATAQTTGYTTVPAMTAYEPRCFCCKKPLTRVHGTKPSPTPQEPDRTVETESMECTDADCIAWRERAKRMSEQIPNPPQTK